MKRLNWSSVVRSIRATRSGKALFFKPVCVIAAIDLANERTIETDDLDAEAILDRFFDYVTPFHGERGSDGYQPLWRLSNNQLWTFFKGDRALTSKNFPDGKPGTRRRLLDGFDRLEIHEDVRQLWASPDGRAALRDQMLLMLQEGDEDSRRMVPALFDPRRFSNRDRWPSDEALDEYFKPLREPSLFDGLGPAPVSPHDHDEPSAPVTAGARRVSPTSSVPDAVENVPSSVDYVWAGNRIVVGPNLASLPQFPSASSERDHTRRLDACALQATDLLRDLERRSWQIREDYRIHVGRYLERLPKRPGSGNILLADAAARILRDLFAAELSILPSPFKATLKALLQQHAALRPFYPEIDSFYRAVRTGRIEETLPLDAVDGIIEVVREQTPEIFDEAVSAAIMEASEPEPDVPPGEAVPVQADEPILPPPDPLGEFDRGKAHDIQVAGVLNRLWKVFTSADKMQSSTAAWIKAYNDLSGPVAQFVAWLRNASGA